MERVKPTLLQTSDWPSIKRKLADTHLAYKCYLGIHLATEQLLLVPFNSMFL